MFIHSYIHVCDITLYEAQFHGGLSKQSCTLAKLHTAAYEHPAKLINIKLFVRRREGHISESAGNIALRELFA